MTSVSAPAIAPAAAAAAAAATPATNDGGATVATHKYSNTSVPVLALTPDNIDKYKQFIKARAFRKRNKFGGYSCDMYLDDGVNKNRPVVIELPEWNSKFGISYRLKSEMDAARKESKGGRSAREEDPKEGKGAKAGSQEDEVWVQSFSVRNNSPQSEELARVIDEVTERELYEHRAKLLDDATLERRDMKRLVSSFARKGDNIESYTNYGANIKIGISPYKKKPPTFYIAEEAEDRPVSIQEIKEMGEGVYTVQFVWTKINLMRGINSAGMDMLSALYIPQAAEDASFATRTIRKAVPPSASTSEAGKATATTPATGADAGAPPVSAGEAESGATSAPADSGATATTASQSAVPVADVSLPPHSLPPASAPAPAPTPAPAPAPAPSVPGGGGNDVPEFTTRGSKRGSRNDDEKPTKRQR